MTTLSILLSATLLAPVPMAPEPQEPTPQPAVASGSQPTAAALAAATDRAAPTRVLFDRPTAEGPLWALGRAWKASFDGAGFTVIPFFGAEAPRNFPLRLELAAATVGGEPLALVHGEASESGGSVRTPRGGLTEVVATSLDSLEQSFVFDTLPNRGAIAVDVRMTGEYTTTAIEHGLRFANDHGHIDYTKAVAVDAAGQRLPLDIHWTGAGVRMEIPASFVAKAQLPIVLDPLLNYWYLLGNPSQLQHDSDVASIQALNGRTLLVWQRQWSASDQDCWGLMFDGGLGLVQTDFTIDFTSEDWLKPAVAGNNYAQNFLVVSQVRIGLQHFIAGRMISSSAVVGAQFNIERDGVVGLPGDNFHPDVGGDPYFGPGRYCVVFQKRTLFTADIYMKQVNTAGGLVTTNPIALDTSGAEESRPSIGKSCGQSNGQPANWFVTWQRTFSASDQDVLGRFVGWNGTLVGSVFSVAGSGGNETAPSACSPIDVEGIRYWPVGYEYATAPGQQRDVMVRLFRGDGTLQTTDMASGGVPNADDRDPEMDSDGTRFVIGMTTGTSGYPPTVEVATIAYLPFGNQCRHDERTGLYTSSLDSYGQINVCADFSGGSAPTARYLVSFTDQTSNTMRLHAYGGHTGGAFFTTRPTQCGFLPIAATGSPVLGQTVTITAANGAASGTLGGTPTYVPLLPVLGCNCILGVDYIGFFGNPFVYTIPNDPYMVGATFSIQGYTVVGSQCLGLLDLSDTIDFTIR